MRSIGVRVAAALVLAIISPLGVAHAQMGAPAGSSSPGNSSNNHPTHSNASPGAISKDQRTKGMAAAPDLVSAGGFDCQVADARLVGEGTDATTKAKVTLYELACTGNEGLLVQKSATAIQAYTCAQANEPGPDGKQSATRCILPANADPAAGIAPYIAKAGKACPISKMRAIGQSPTNNVFEVACQDGSGWILAVSSPPRLDKPISMDPCFAYPPGGNISCKLTDSSSQLAVIDRLMAKSGKTCTIKDRRYVGATTSGSTFYEASCQEGKGYMVETAANGDFKQAIDCAGADAIAGGCTLTDARQAKPNRPACTRSSPPRPGSSARCRAMRRCRPVRQGRCRNGLFQPSGRRDRHFRRQRE